MVINYFPTLAEQELKRLIVATVNNNKKKNKEMLKEEEAKGFFNGRKSLITFL